MHTSTFAIFSINSTTNFLKPGRASLVNLESQKIELSQSLSWALRKHMKCVSSIHEGSGTPQSEKCLKHDHSNYKHCNMLLS